MLGLFPVLKTEFRRCDLVRRTWGLLSDALPTLPCPRGQTDLCMALGERCKLKRGLARSGVKGTTLSNRHNRARIPTTEFKRKKDQRTEGCKKIPRKSWLRSYHSRNELLELADSAISISWFPKLCALKLASYPLSITNSSFKYIRVELRITLGIQLVLQWLFFSKDNPPNGRSLLIMALLVKKTTN